MSLADDSPISKGVNCHKALEQFYNNEPISELNDFNKLIVANYLKWAECNDQFEVLATESSFEVPFFDSNTFNGRFDLVIRLNSGKIWINDYKFTSVNFDRYTEYIMFQNEQARAYSYAARYLFGDDFGGIMFTLIKSKPPEEPKVLKNGTLSKDKSQQVDWPNYQAKLSELNLNQTDYLDMKAVLPDFIRRVQYKRFSDQAINLWLKRNIEIAKEMLPEYNNDSLSFYPSENIINCQYCAFKFPCYIYNNISTYQAIKLVENAYPNSDYATNIKDELTHE